MRLFLKIVLGVALFVAALVFIAGQFISSEDVISQIQTKVEDATGRKLSVDGESTLRVFPSLTLSLEQVRFSNFAAGTQPDMVSIEEVMVHIPWMSLLTGEVNIDKFVINNPQILLEKDSQGLGNWQFFQPSNNANDPAETGQSKQIELPKGFDVKLGQVAIVGGSLTYTDAVTGESKVLDKLGLDIDLPSLREELTVTGTVRYMNQEFTLTSTVTTPIAAIEMQPFVVALELDSQLMQLNYQGEIKDRGKHLTGNLTIDTPSVKNILAWQNIELNAKDEAFNKLSLSTKIEMLNDTFSLNGLQFLFDKLDVKGAAKITLTTPLNINAEVDLGELDVNPYLPTDNATANAETPTSKDTSTEEAQPIVWDDSEIDLSSLKQLNAEIKIKSSGLKFKDIKLEQNQLSLSLQDGLANIVLSEFNGYQGTGSGAINLDTRTKPYQVSTEFSLANIDANTLLNDAAGFDKLLGNGQLGWKLTTTGISQKDFINTLAGEANFSFIDGAIKGFNLAAIAKSAKSLLKGDFSAINLDKDFSNSDQTDFAALTGSFQLTQGVATTTDISLTNPFIRVQGEGKIDLPVTKVNMKVKTELVASSEGQDSAKDSSGIVIPIKISGPFHKIKVKPDVSSESKKKLKDKVSKKLKDLFG